MPRGGRALPWGLWQHKPFPWHRIRFHMCPPPVHATPTLPFPLCSLVRRTRPTLTELSKGEPQLRLHPLGRRSISLVDKRVLVFALCFL